jgi:hypothetical protein
MLSSAAILQFMTERDALAIAGLNRTTMAAFVRGHLSGELALPCFDQITFKTSPLAPSRVLFAVLQQVRCAVFACGGTGTGGGSGSGGSSSSGCGVAALKQVLTMAPRLQAVEIVRPTVALLKRLALVVPAGPFTDLSLGRAGYSNVAVTDAALAEMLAKVGPRLASLSLVKLNGITCESLHSIAEHCGPRLRRLVLVSCAQVRATSTTAPQGVEHVLHALGPHVTDWDVRFSLDMCDRWLVQLADVRRRAEALALALAAGALPMLRTFIASRTTPNSASHNGCEGAMLTPQVWHAFCAQFHAATLLYVDCVGQEGIDARADATVFLHDGLRGDAHSNGTQIRNEQSSYHTRTSCEAVDDYETTWVAAQRLRACVVVRPLSHELFGGSPAPEPKAKRPPGEAAPRQCLPYDAFFCLPLRKSGDGGGSGGCAEENDDDDDEDDDEDDDDMYPSDDGAMDEEGYGDECFQRLQASSAGSEHDRRAGFEDDCRPTFLHTY